MRVTKIALSFFNFFFLFFLVLSTQSIATHIVGADMSYKGIGGNKYIFTLNVYRDCGSLIRLENTQTIYYYSTSCVIPQDSLVLRTTSQGIGKDISPVCNKVKSTCKGGTLPGVEKFSFEDTVTLTTACRDWIFYYKECNRSSDIKNIVAPGTKCLYIEARLNNLDAANNSSPSFGNEPVSFVCINRDAQLDNGAIEPDGDLLRFRLVNPRTNTRISEVNDLNILTYKAPFSAKYPLQTQGSIFNFDSLSGSISFNPTLITRTVTALQVEEYRNGKLIGSVMRDLQIVVQECINNIPQLQKLTGTNGFETTICLGGTKDIDFTGEDGDPEDSVTITWNNPFPGAIYNSVKGKKKSNAKIRWTPTLSDTGLVLVNLTITDNNCPTVGNSSASYKLFVKPSPKVALRNDTNLNCGVTIPVTAKIIEGRPPFRLSWSGISDTTRTVRLGNGIHSVTLKDATGCTSTDGLIIAGGATTRASISIDSFCVGQLVSLESSLTNIPQGVTFSYLWKITKTDTTPGKVVFNSIATLPTYRFRSPGAYEINLRIKGSDSCTYTTTYPVNICLVPVIDSIRFVIPNQRPCFGQPISFRIFEKFSSCPVTQWTIINKPPQSTVNQTFVSTSTNVTITNGLFPVGNNRLVISGKTANGCTVSSFFEFDVTSKPSVRFLKPSIPFPCNQPSVTLTIRASKPPNRPLDAYRLFIIQGTDTTITSLTTADSITRDVIVTKPQIVRVIARIEGSSCEATATGTVFFPLVGVANASTFCKIGDSTRFTSAPTSPFGIKSFFWILPNNDTLRTRNPIKSYEPGKLLNVRYFVEDSSTCKDTVSFTLNTKLPDTTSSILEDIICFKTPFQFFYPVDSLVNSWTWKAIQDSITITNPNLRNGKLVLTKSGLNPVNLRIRYKNTCVKRWTVDSVLVRQPVIVKFIMKNICAKDSSSFSAFQISSEFPIAKYKWDFSFDHMRRDPIKDSGQFVKQLFDTSGEFNVDLTGINEKGCIGTFRLDTSIVLVSEPIFDIEGDCQDDSLKFINGDAIDEYENIRRFGYAFGDGATQINEDGSAFHRFQNVGTYQVQFSAYSKEGCVKTFTKPLVIKPRPEVIYSTGLNPCFGTLINLDASASKASTPNEQILERIWIIDADTVSRTSLASINFDTIGPHAISHWIKSENGCTDKLTYLPNVLPTPTAGFIADEFELLDKDFLTFQNTSKNASYWEYRYGDGIIDTITDPSLASPVHYYVGGGEFKAIQIVKNVEGCSDTLDQNLRLRPYLALPSAFTPNGDEVNDVFKLQYRLIRKIDEYKVFNRFGEVVFQTTELDKVWDGKQNNADVPAGSYLFLVKATSVFGEGLSTKGSVNVIR